MQNLFATTAMVLALGLPSLALAETNVPAATTAADIIGFLASRGMTDMLATDLIGHDVYARRVAAEMQASGAPMTSMAAKDLETMDNIGQINDLVLSADGKVQAIVIGVGGFIGVGEQDVAVTLDQVSFATDATNPKDMYVVINTPGEVLKTSPAFKRTAAMEADQAATTPAATAERARLIAPTLERDGYTRAAVGDMSIDLLIGKTVYGLDDSNVGTVSDVMMNDAGAVQDVIIDFGGFLGMGKTHVALSFDELTILTNAGNEDIRIYVDATKEQVQAMPTYTPVN